MSKQSDPAQGVIIPAKAIGSGRAIPRKDGNAIIARAGEARAAYTRIASEAFTVELEVMPN